MSAPLDWRRIEAALVKSFKSRGWYPDRIKLSADIVVEQDGTPTVELNLTLLAQDLAKELER